MLFNLLSDLVKIDDVLFVIKNNGAISEVRSNTLTIRQKEKWITIGNNEDPAHLHVDSSLIKSASFIQEKKPDRTSFSVRFFDQNDQRIIAAFFTKMYDESKVLISERKKTYDNLDQKYRSKIQF